MEVEIYINESIIRAIQTYFLEKSLNKTFPGVYINHSKQGFSAVNKLTKVLHDMEGKQFSNFEEKYLMLFKTLMVSIN